MFVISSCYTRFFFRKIGCIYLAQKSVFRPSVTFHVIVSSPKLLDEATSNFAGA